MMEIVTAVRARLPLFDPNDESFVSEDARDMGRYLEEVEREFADRVKALRARIDGGEILCPAGSYPMAPWLWMSRRRRGMDDAPTKDPTRKLWGVSGAYEQPHESTCSCGTCAKIRGVDFARYLRADSRGSAGYFNDGEREFFDSCRVQACNEHGLEVCGECAFDKRAENDEDRLRNRMRAKLEIAVARQKEYGIDELTRLYKKFVPSELATMDKEHVHASIYTMTWDFWTWVHFTQALEVFLGDKVDMDVVRLRIEHHRLWARPIHKEDEIFMATPTTFCVAFSNGRKHGCETFTLAHMFLEILMIRVEGVMMNYLSVGDDKMGHQDVSLLDYRRIIRLLTHGMWVTLRHETDFLLDEILSALYIPFHHLRERLENDFIPALKKFVNEAVMRGLSRNYEMLHKEAVLEMWTKELAAAKGSWPPLPQSSVDVLQKACDLMKVRALDEHELKICVRAFPPSDVIIEKAARIVDSPSAGKPTSASAHHTKASKAVSAPSTTQLTSAQGAPDSGVPGAFMILPRGSINVEMMKDRTNHALVLFVLGNKCLPEVRCPEEMQILDRLKATIVIIPVPLSATSSEVFESVEELCRNCVHESIVPKTSREKEEISTYFDNSVFEYAECVENTGSRPFKFMLDCERLAREEDDTIKAILDMREVVLANDGEYKERPKRLYYKRGNEDKFEDIFPPQSSNETYVLYMRPKAFIYFSVRDGITGDGTAGSKPQRFKVVQTVQWKRVIAAFCDKKKISNVSDVELWMLRDGMPPEIRLAPDFTPETSQYNPGTDTLTIKRKVGAYDFQTGTDKLY